MLRFCGQRTMQGYNIAFLEQLVQGYVVDIAILRRKFVKRNDFHAESAANVDEYPPDLARTDNAYRFPVQVESRQAVHMIRTRLIQNVSRFSLPQIGDIFLSA